MQSLLVISVAVVMAGALMVLGYLVGTAVASRRIVRSLQKDRAVGLQVLEELAELWGVKIEHQQTPGGT